MPNVKKSKKSLNSIILDHFTGYSSAKIDHIMS